MFLKIFWERYNKIVYSPEFQINSIVNMTPRRCFPDVYYHKLIWNLPYLYSSKDLEFCKLMTQNKMKFAW